MSKKNDKNELATRADVEEIVGRVVGEIVGDALQMIAERFDKVDARFDKIEAEQQVHTKRLDTIDDKFGIMVEEYADQHLDIRRLKKKLAMR